MCTLGAKKIKGSFFLFKNRDREYCSDTRLKRENGKTKKLLIVDQRGHCEGMNEHGIGFVEATLQPFPRTRFRPISQLARRMLDQNTAEGAIDIIRRNKTSVNVVVGDANSAFIVEKTPHEFAVVRIKDAGIITNHSIRLKRKTGPKLESVRGWSRARYKRAKHLVKNVRGISGIKKLLSDREGYPGRSILGGIGWRIPTQASYILDLKGRKILFCNGQPGTHPFAEHKL